MGKVFVQSLWWLHPAFLYTIVVGGTMALAIGQSDQNYALYNTPKYLTNYHGLLAFGTIIAFVTGCAFALSTGKAPKPTSTQRLSHLDIALLGLLGLTLFGYAVWFLVGVKNGFSLGMLMDAIFSDDPDLTYSLSTTIFKNVPGVTTCVQFGSATVLLGVWLYSLGNKRALLPVVLVIGAGFVRALFLSERLALIELVVPATIMAFRQFVLFREYPKRIGWTLQAAPLLGVVVLLVFFGGAEYLRSWKFYQKDFDSVVEFTVWRMSGYYTTCHNNSAMALETETTYDLPYYTIQSMWVFPGVSESKIGYRALTGIEPDSHHKNMLEQFGTPELNNGGGLFQPALDFGIIGMFIFWGCFGFVSGRLYRSYLAGAIVGLLFYPLFMLAILEVPRLLYLSNQRTLPAILAVTALVWYVRREERASAIYSPQQHPAPTTGGNMPA